MMMMRPAGAKLKKVRIRTTLETIEWWIMTQHHTQGDTVVSERYCSSRGVRG